MIADINVAYSDSQPLKEWLDYIDEFSIFSELKVGATKTKNVVVKIISKNQKEILAQILRELF